MIKRLRIKFVCINMVIVTVMLCAVLGLVYQRSRASLERESIGMMQAVAVTPDPPTAPDAELYAVRLPYFLLRVDEAGAPLSYSGSYFDLSDRATLRDLTQQAVQSGQSIGVLEDYHLRFCLVSTAEGNFVVFADTSNEESTLRSLLVTCILIGVLAFVAFLGISIALAWWAVRPVDRAWRQQRQFVADASHELKTPLTVILTDAELMREGGGDLSGDILTMAKRMRSLTESLLDLARIDHGIPGAVLAPMDLSQTVSDSLLLFEPLFYEKGLDLIPEIQESLTVTGSQEHLAQVTAILLDNAMKYSAPGSSVVLELKQTGRRHCLLSVSNEGEELTKEELQNIFKRFYRRDEVRSMDGSYGLGLSIAQGIVERHRGSIWADSGGGRNTFYVLLPMKA